MWRWAEGKGWELGEGRQRWGAGGISNSVNKKKKRENYMGFTILEKNKEEMKEKVLIARSSQIKGTSVLINSYVILGL